MRSRLCSPRPRGCPRRADHDGLRTPLHRRRGPGSAPSVASTVGTEPPIHTIPAGSVPAGSVPAGTDDSTDARATLADESGNMYDAHLVRGITARFGTDPSAWRVVLRLAPAMTDATVTALLDTVAAILSDPTEHHPATV